MTRQRERVLVALLSLLLCVLQLGFPSLLVESGLASSSEEEPGEEKSERLETTTEASHWTRRSCDVTRARRGKARRHTDRGPFPASRPFALDLRNGPTTPLRC